MTQHHVHAFLVHILIQQEERVPAIFGLHDERVAVTDEKLLPVELIKERNISDVPDYALIRFEHPASREISAHPQVSGIVDPKMPPLLAASTSTA